VSERFKRVFPRNRPTEGRQVTEVIGKTVPDEPHDVSCHGVWGEASSGGHDEMLWQGFPVIGVIVPLTALRPVAVHEPPGLTAHLPVEKLHAKALAPLRPAGEFSPRAKEPIIFTNLNRRAEHLAPGLHHFPNPPFPGFRHNDAVHKVT